MKPSSWWIPVLLYTCSILLRGVPSLSGFGRKVYAARTSSAGVQHTIGHEGGVRLAAGSVSVKFKALCVVTTVCIFGLITLGGVVRLTGSGLGCPDWPLCHGNVLPPWEYHALIEYSHRLLASIVGVMVVVLGLVVWRWHRQRSWLLVPATLAVVLLFTQAMLGGATVMQELHSDLVMAHLAVAEALMACMVVLTFAVTAGPVQTPANFLASNRSVGAPLWRAGSSRLLVLIMVGMAATYALLLTGANVSAAGATISCGEGWPLCQGQLFPDGQYAWLNFGHRIVAGLVGVLVVTAVIMAWRWSSLRDPLRWAALVLAAVFLVQIGLGASIVTAGFTLAARLTHLSAATLTWVAFLVMLLALLRVPRGRLEGSDGA